MLAACQSTQPVPETIVVTPPVSSLDELQSLSVEARHELRLLAKAQEAVAQEAMTAEQHKARFAQATYVPPGFEKIVELNYVGPAVEAAKAIAIVAGYELAVYGKPPVNPPFVRLEVHRKPLNEALKELGVQTGSTIRVEVHPAAKLMRLVYQS